MKLNIVNKTAGKIDLAFGIPEERANELCHMLNDLGEKLKRQYEDNEISLFGRTLAKSCCVV